MKTLLLLITFVVGSLSCACAVSAAKRTPVILVDAPSERLVNSKISAMCAGLPEPCAPMSTKAYVERNSRAGPIYLIDSSRPMIVALDPLAKDAEDRARFWDFGTYVHSSTDSADQDTLTRPTIYPALYPIGLDGYAIALVQKRSEAYSGGGASFEVADFLELNRGTDRSRRWEVSYTAVPFFCQKSIRACFSEKDYKSSPHCLDEYTGSLRIDISDNSTTSWSFTWNESNWPANSAASRTATTRTVFSVRPGAPTTLPAVLPREVTFCDGGPAR